MLREIATSWTIVSLLTSVATVGGAASPETFVDRSVAVAGVDGQFLAVSARTRQVDSGGTARVAFFGLGLAPNGTVARYDFEFAAGTLGGSKTGKFAFDIGLGGQVFGSSTHGLVVLGGMRFDWVGAEKLYYTQLELLYLAAGYAYRNTSTFAQIGPRVGLVVDGRFNPDTADFRRINLFSLGLEANVRSRWAFGQLFVGRTIRVSSHPGIPNGPVDTFRGLLCGTVYVALCIEGRAYRAEVIVPFEGIREVSATQIGVLLGVGLGGG